MGCNREDIVIFWVSDKIIGRTADKGSEISVRLDLYRIDCAQCWKDSVYSIISAPMSVAIEVATAMQVITGIR